MRTNANGCTTPSFSIDAYKLDKDGKTLNNKNIVSTLHLMITSSKIFHFSLFVISFHFGWFLLLLLMMLLYLSFIVISLYLFFSFFIHLCVNMWTETRSFSWIRNFFSFEFICFLEEFFLFNNDAEGSRLKSNIITNKKSNFLFSFSELRFDIFLLLFICWRNWNFSFFNPNVLWSLICIQIVCIISQPYKKSILQFIKGKKE